MNKRTFLGFGLMLALPWRASFSQSRYPDRPVRLVVPFSPGGGGADFTGRLWAKYAAPLFGGTVVVENKPGAGGAIGAADVARAQADGYALLFGSTTTQIILPAASAKPPYDPKDFALVGIVSVNPTCIIVHRDVPAKSLKDFVALVKASPGKYVYGSSGAGTITNLAGEIFKLQAGGLDMPHVPYKGGAQAMQDLIAGHIPVTMPLLSADVLAQHRAGRARILGVNSDVRLKVAPEIPTSIEEGVPDMQVQVFNAVFAPAATPRDVLQVLREATLKMRTDGAFLQELHKAGAEPFSQNDEKFVAEELARWNRVIRAIGFKVQ